MLMNRKQNFKLCVCFIVAVLWLILDTVPAHAHRVTIFAWVDGDMIHTQSKIGGGKQIKDASVIVYGPRGVALLEGKTDNKGMFSFRIPQKTDLSVVLNAASGHSAEWTIPVEEVSRSTVENAASGNPELFATGPSPNAAAVQTPTIASKTPETVLTKEDIEAIVNRALEKKLQPVVQMMAKAYDREPGITEIMGGFGYILGLVGIALYVANRRKKTND